ncbi:MAG: hypothetical protein DRP16_01955, partial [Candidatus Aenigmatarchaeota archaeon]
MVKKYTLKECIELYKKSGKRNAEYLFNWLRNIYDFCYLPCIDEKYKDILADDKTKLTIVDVLIDDLADNYKLRNEKLLEESIKIPFSSQKNITDNYLKIIQKIWVDCFRSIKQYPAYKKFKTLFFFDLTQTLNSMRYSYLLNKIKIGNSLENKMHLPHGVMVLLHSDMDLMCSSKFNENELKYLRPFLYLAQEISHIGNLLNTYPREII